jgi:hypothetical protein
LDPKNATEALFLTKSKFHLKGAMYLDYLPLLKKKKDFVLKILAHPMHQLNNKNQVFFSKIL